MNSLLTADLLKGKNVDANLAAFFTKLRKDEQPRIANRNIAARFSATINDATLVSQETYRLIFKHYINAGASAYTIHRLLGDTPRITKEELPLVMRNEPLRRSLILVIAPLISSAQREQLAKNLDSQLERGEQTWRITYAERIFLVKEAGANAVKRYLKYPLMHDALLKLNDLNAHDGRIIMRAVRKRGSGSARAYEFLEAPSEELTTLQCALAKRSIKSDYAGYTAIPFHKTDMKFNHIMLKNLIKKYRYGKGRPV